METQTGAAGIWTGAAGTQTGPEGIWTGAVTLQTLPLVEMPIRPPEPLACALPPEGVRIPRESSGNSLRPFCTTQRPTCGFRFSQNTDHRRKHNGLQACNPNKWRSFIVPQ